jgi:type II secretory pathway component PulF
MSSKIDSVAFFKSLLFALENGKSIPQALESMILHARVKSETKIYEKILNSLRDGERFSSALAYQKIFSKEIISFVIMAESSNKFKESLKNILYFLESREEFFKSSNDKIALPFIYFLLASIVVLSLRFLAIPYQMEQIGNYDKQVIALITEHLNNALLMSDFLFGFLLISGTYFTIMLFSLFNNSRVIQNVSSSFALLLPLSSTIVKTFEKFMIFAMLGALLNSGVTFKNSLYSAYENTKVGSFKKIFLQMIENLKIGRKDFYNYEIFDEIEKSILSNVGTSSQLGVTFLDISKEASLKL